MSRSFEFYVEPRQVAKLAFDLSEIEGVEVSLPTEDVARPDPTKEHPAYSISFAELSPVIISLMSASVSIIALATAIMQYKKAAKEAEKATKEAEKKPTEASQAPVLVIHNTPISIANFSTPELLAVYLTEQLKQLPDEGR